MEGRYTVETPAKDLVLLVGGFATNGASAPSAAQLFGNWISSVTHDSTGVYTVTMKPDFRALQLVAKGATLSLATVADSAVQLGPYNATLGTLVVRTLTAGAVADIAANADNFVSLQLSARYGRNQDGSVLYDS